MYYNRRADFPQIWSVDEGSHASEINVRDVAVLAPMHTHFDAEAKYPEPNAWLDCDDCHIEITSGTAVIRRGPR